LVLKSDYIVNEKSILEKEQQLNKIVDLEMKYEMEKLSNYELINDEKITPHFLTLAKVSKKSESLTQICNGTGSEFEHDGDRVEYIRSFFENIYVQDSNAAPLSDSCVEDFLGPEICENETVKNSKLTQDEKEFFDREFTLNEFDVALQGLNEKSAGGMDGISAKFLKKFWYCIRIPLYRYANHSFENKTLTQSFNSASIKLIPKKGDLKAIKNWRPISLLNCVFKVISKAVDNRLEKINDIILSRAQKGFTSKRFIHECIINITETIAYNEKNNIPAFILALDMAKAFDT
jgi:Reverse transcriptase (RNA-dependent DNA polymerase)